MLFSPKQDLARIKAFDEVPKTAFFSSNLNSCSQRMCEEIGPNLRKDDSRDSTLATYTMRYLSMVGSEGASHNREAM